MIGFYYSLSVLLFIYVISCIAVALWHELVRGTERMSWVDNTQIFFPVYNTIIAWELWREFNPLK